MNTAPIEAVIWSLIAITWWAFHWPYRQSRTEKTRRQLLGLQATLSDAAARGELIHSEDRSYRITHTTLNGMLRTLDDCTLVRLTFLVWKSASDRSWKEMVNRYVDETERALDTLPEDGRKLIEKTTNDACRAMLDCTMATSLILRALRIPIAMLRPIQSPSKLNEHIRSLSRRLDQALRYASNLAERVETHEF